MGLTFRRTVRRGRNRVNLSKGGVSLSRGIGPVSLSTRGRGSVRLGKGIRYLFRL